MQLIGVTAISFVLFDYIVRLDFGSVTNHTHTQKKNFYATPPLSCQSKSGSAEINSDIGADSITVTVIVTFPAAWMQKLG